MSFKTPIKVAALAGAALGLGLLGLATAATAHTWHENWKPVSVKVQASGQSEWHSASFYPEGVYGANHFRFYTERLSAGPHVKFEAPYAYPPASYQANVATLQLKLELDYSPPSSAKVEVVWKLVGGMVSVKCDNYGPWENALSQSGELKVVFASLDPTKDEYLKMECQDWQGKHIVHVFVEFIHEPQAVELEWRQWTNTPVTTEISETVLMIQYTKPMFGPTGGAWSYGTPKVFPVMDLPVKPGYFNEPGGYGVRARAAGLPNAKWTAWRDFCIGDPAGCFWQLLTKEHFQNIYVELSKLGQAHPQDSEVRDLLREAQTLPRAALTAQEVAQFRRDAERLGRDVVRVKARLAREQQRAAAGSPAPAKPEAPAPGSPPDQPAGPPQVAAVPRPTAPARDPVAEEAAKELEALAKRLTALGANPEAQRFLREVQLLQRQLGGEPGQAPVVLREAKRLGGEVDRLEARLRQPTITPRLGPQAPAPRLQ